MTLRRGDRVALFPPLVHFDEEKFDKPDEWDYTRYLKQQASAASSSSSAAAPPLMPFGGGVSLCPGRTFARREIAAFLRLLLTRYDLALEDPHAPPPPPDLSRVGLGIIPPKPGADVGLVVMARA